LIPGQVGAERELGQLADAVARGDGPTEVVKAIRCGEDPLGAAFCRLRSAAERRPAGATYTPRAVVDAMVSAARSLEPSPACVVDPGAGSGRFSLAAAAAFPGARIVAVEIDALAARVLRANAEAAGISDRVEVVTRSFLDMALPEIDGRTLFVGNPPYVRHHKIPAAAKEAYSARMARFGIRASQLAGLHLHFLAKIAELARDGDGVCLITAAEWLDVNYGSAARALLAGRLGLARLDVLEPCVEAFSDAMTSAVVLSCVVGSRPRMIAVRRHATIDGFSLEGGQGIASSKLRSLDRWSGLGRAKPAGNGGARLGDYFRVSRGQVTGSNALWVVNAGSGLPARFLRASITRARELIEAGPVLDRADGLKTVADLPADLDVLDQDERRTVERFIERVKAAGGADGYIARHRRPWWAVRLLAPAPIISTYMARRPPTFVLNRARVRHINIAHGFYPRGEINEEMLAALVRWLRLNVGIDGGRAYAGGLIKFEPGELERLVVPPIERWNDEQEATDGLDGGADPGQLRSRSGGVSSRTAR
jgi:hypothetical protein